jgi:hypothetical protein
MDRDDSTRPRGNRRERRATLTLALSLSEGEGIVGVDPLAPGATVLFVKRVAMAVDHARWR